MRTMGYFCDLRFKNYLPRRKISKVSICKMFQFQYPQVFTEHSRDVLGGALLSKVMFFFLYFSLNFWVAHLDGRKEKEVAKETVSIQTEIQKSGALNRTITSFWKKTDMHIFLREAMHIPSMPSWDYWFGHYWTVANPFPLVDWWTQNTGTWLLLNREGTDSWCKQKYQA